MKYLTNAILCLLLTTGIACRCVRPDNQENLSIAVSQAMKSSVILTTKGGFCGGVIVAPDKVLTAYHCMTRKVDRKLLPDGYITTSDQRVYRVETEKTSEKSDLALLKITDQIDPPLTQVQVAQVVPSAGSKILTIGDGKGIPFVLSVGYISIGSYIRDDMRNTVFDLNVAPGSSGGGVFDSNGNLISIMQGYYRGTGWSFGIHLKIIIKFLEQKK